MRRVASRRVPRRQPSIDASRPAGRQPVTASERGVAAMHAQAHRAGVTIASRQRALHRRDRGARALRLHLGDQRLDTRRGSMRRRTAPGRRRSRRSGRRTGTRTDQLARATGRGACAFSSWRHRAEDHALEHPQQVDRGEDDAASWRARPPSRFDLEGADQDQELADEAVQARAGRSTRSVTMRKSAAKRRHRRSTGRRSRRSAACGAARRACRRAGRARRSRGRG